MLGLNGLFLSNLKIICWYRTCVICKLFLKFKREATKIKMTKNFRHCVSYLHTKNREPPPIISQQFWPLFSIKNLTIQKKTTFFEVHTPKFSDPPAHSSHHVCSFLSFFVASQSFGCVVVFFCCQMYLFWQFLLI